MKRLTALLIVIVLSCVIAVSFCEPKAISLEARNINLVKLSFFAINKGDFASLADLYSPDYLQHSPDFKDPQTWPKYELACRIVHSRIPDLQLRIIDIFAFEDKVAVRSVWEYPRDPSWSSYGMWNIDLNGSSISIYRIKNGMIIEEWCEYDPAIIKRFCTFYKAKEHNR